MDKNPFEILNIEPKPILDLAALRKSYIQLQKNGHPDLGNNPEISEWANQAYSLLKSDESRMSQILKHYGTWPPNTNLIGMDFLMEAMELSEEIDNIKENSDRVRIEGAIHALINGLDNQLMEIHGKTENKSDWYLNEEMMNEVSIWYQRRRYLTRLEKNLKGEHEL